MFFLYGASTMFKEVEKPKVLKVTAALAKSFRDMRRYPRDREIKPFLYEHLKKETLAGRFRGTEWVTAKDTSTGLVYRLNGKHTSTLLSELFDAGGLTEDGKPLNVYVTVRHYECADMEEMAALFATFDPRQSSRTKGDLVLGYAAVEPLFDNITPRHLNLITVGLAYNLWEDNYSHRDITEQTSLLLQYPKFAQWVYLLLPSLGGTSPYSHMGRSPVVAAMARTWFKSSELAAEFWQKIRDDSDDPKDSPPRVLYRWLTRSTLGAKRGKKGKTVSHREMFARCMHAWNAWRRGESTKLTYYADKPIPQAA